MRIIVPFRGKPFLIPRRVYAAILPAYALIGIGSIMAWLIWAESLVKGGWQHTTAGEAFIFAGFAGIAILQVFSTAVVIVVLESVMYDARTALSAELLQVLARVTPPPVEPPEPPAG